jgi:hypothetical protein
VTFPYAQPVTWVTRTVNGRDAYGNDVYTTTSTQLQAVFAPGGSSEIVQGGDVVTTQPTLYGIPDGTLITATDQFVIGGQRYEVDGEPQSWGPHPLTGWSPGMVVQLRKVTGS